MRRSTERHIFVLRRVSAVLVICLLVLPSFLLPRSVSALSNDYILSDSELFDGSSMSADRIQRFLEQHGSYLAQLVFTEGSSSKRASDVIAETSATYDLSPKFFLTLLEKEQSLVSDPHPSQHQLDYALGFGCPSSCSSRFRGFPNQLLSAGKQIREEYLPALQQRGQYNGWGPSITKRTIDGLLVTPANVATAILYIYNPYVGKYGGGDQRWGANSLFQKLWVSWFVRKHPDGSLLRVEGEPGIWLIRNGKRSAFKSRSAFVSNYDYSKVIVVDRDEIETYDKGPSISFPEPSLLQVKTGGVYLLVNGTKRPISSRDVLRTLGYNPEEIIRGINERELALYPKGTPVTKDDLYPNGRLLQSKKTGGIYFLDSENIKHPIYSKEIYRSQFRSQRPERTSDELLATYPTGDPVKFRDGELVASRTTKKVYFVSNGERRAIPDIEIFRQLGFKRKNIILTDDRSLEIHPLGMPLNDIASVQE